MLFQVTSALVVVRHYLRKACRSEFSGNGVFYNNPFHDAPFCHHVYCLLPMEDEQRTRFHHVLALLCIRRCITYVRIRIYSMPCLNMYNIRKHSLRKYVTLSSEQNLFSSTIRKSKFRLDNIRFEFYTIKNVF